MNYTYKIFIIGCLFLIGFSCEDLDRFPTDQPTSATFYSTEPELILAVNACYRDITREDSRYILESLYDMTTDIAFNRGGYSGYQAVARGEGNSFTGAFSEVWDRQYRGINKCNTLLDNMSKAQEVTDPDVFARINAEARFLRAWYYHRLVELYGDVPLITTVLPVGEEFVSKDPKTEIVDFILDELLEVADDLPVSYAGANVGRATFGAAHSLRARIALYNERWQDAIESAELVINGGAYSLFPNYRNLFTYAGENSSEVIFDYQFLDGFSMHGTPRNNQSRMGGGFSQQVPTQVLVDSYECIDGLPIDESPLYDPADPFSNRDPRLDASIVLPATEWAGYIFETHRDSTTTLNLNTNTIVQNQDVTNPFASFTGYVWKKYLDDIDLTNLERSSINWILIRYAEVLLTYAEAKIEANQIDQSVLDALNEVRARAYGVSIGDTGLYPAVTTTDQNELRTYVRRERKVELAYEGFRLFDIRRWRIAEDVMNGPLYGRPARDYSVMGIPVIDENASPDLSAYGSVLRVVEQREFDPARDYLWALPQNDLNVNDNLTQNPEY
ncbi:MAG: RagB/SusD family nutrient uptake outer membrane protein [Cyclobacteriaceae bacterium]